ncbi:hypothetical protein GCM10022295_24250 [Streptomyces osmaniensis]|uniref:Uncharacterized protein n=1 Tax=Streptomyces osmaniensis TaxID=593134 RepID=A0ABP6VZF1_9ACTN
MAGGAAESVSGGAEAGPQDSRRPASLVLHWRSRSDVPAARGSGDCLEMGRLHAYLTCWSGTALRVVAGR